MASEIAFELRLVCQEETSHIKEKGLGVLGRRYFSSKSCEEKDSSACLQNLQGS